MFKCWINKPGIPQCCHVGRNLQGSRSEYRNYQSLPPQRQIQLVDGRQWKNQDCEIGHHIIDPSGTKRPVKIKASTCVHHRVPDLPTWTEHGYGHDRVDQIERQATPDGELNQVEHRQIVFPIRHENMKILKEDGEFDEENDRTIDDY